uniref:PLAT domain-containing protein n=1 Tax=Cucumis melo TaxID=3656 RepID=A0A9I9EIH6_CUCME
MGRIWYAFFERWNTAVNADGWMVNTVQVRDLV